MRKAPAGAYADHFVPHMGPRRSHSTHPVHGTGIDPEWA